MHFQSAVFLYNVKEHLSLFSEHSDQSFFYSPTDAQVNHLKNNFKIYIKIDIKTAPTCFNNLNFSKHEESGFGGLDVACWPLVPKFAGSNPVEAIGFFRAKKILSTPSFGGEVKPSVPCRRFTACKRFLNATWKSGILCKIHRPFLAHIVPPLATRISGETTSGESWNV